MRKLHAWYSARMAKILGTFRYQKEDGEIVIGTIATHTMEHGCLWDDMAYLGEIVRCCGKETKGEKDDLEYDDEGVKKMFEIIDRENKRDKDPNRWN